MTGPFVAVLDYGIGNLRSAEKALQRVGAAARLVTDPAECAGADGVVLPGVGSFGRCMEALRDSGLDKVALDAVDRGLPFMGICVGMQMLYRESEESPGVSGLGVVDAPVVLLRGDVKRPQMQWNPLSVSQPVGPLAGLDGRWVYFVHSYAGESSPETAATCDYGGPVTAALATERWWATQFHPEKSGAAGLELLAGFVAVCGDG